GRHALKRSFPLTTRPEGCIIASNRAYTCNDVAIVSAKNHSVKEKSKNETDRAFCLTHEQRSPQQLRHRPDHRRAARPSALEAHCGSFHQRAVLGGRPGPGLFLPQLCKQGGRAPAPGRGPATPVAEGL